MRKSIAILVCLIMVFSTLLVMPAYAATEDGEAPKTDFIVMLDCSWSINKSDPNYLCLMALKAFVDTIPSQDARISVLTFGYEEEKGYPFSNPQNTKDELRVHEIVSMMDTTTDSKRECKDIVSKTFTEKTKDTNSYTPIGCTLEAAVDILTKNGTSESDACIIMITDGVRESSQNDKIDDARGKEAAAVAKKNNWPIYSIGINYNLHNPDDLDTAHMLLDYYCGAGGENAIGRIDCATPEEVKDAFLKIYADFFNIEFEINTIKLPGEFTFEVPDLTSEAAVNIFGSSVEYVEIYDSNNTLIRKINKSFEDSNILAVVEPGAYYSIKLICPDTGRYTVKLFGEKNALADASFLSLQEMGLKMVVNSSSGSMLLNKKDSADISAYFSYKGHDVFKSDFYSKVPNAILRVINENGTAKEFDMNTSENGYTCSVPTSDIPSGESTLQVILKSNIFRNGEKLSNTQSISVVNNPVMLLNEAEQIDLQLYVNGESERIDVSRIFNNPDADPVTYNVVCTNDRSMEFGCTEDSGYLTIKGPCAPGDFQLEIQAKDDGMSVPVVFNKLSAKVINRDIKSEKLGTLELWTDRYLFQKKTVGPQTIDLNDYFTDPDGVEIVYTIQGGDNSLAQLQLDGGMLTAEPKNIGNTSFEIIGSDGFSSESETLKLIVISGRKAFWRDNWIKFAVAVFILVCIITYVAILFKNKKVKGEWTIAVNLSGNQYRAENFNIRWVIPCGKRTKILLKDMLTEAAPYIEGLDAVWSTSASEYFVQGAEKIKLVGVLRKYGCTVVSIPRAYDIKDTVFSATCNGVAGKKLKVNPGDSLNFKLPGNGENGSVMEVVMILNSDVFT